MTGRGWLNGILLLVLVGLALIAYWRPGLEPTDSPAEMLTTLQPAQIDRIVLQHPGAEPIHLRKQATQWVIESPIRVAANPFRMDTLLQLPTARSFSAFAFVPEQAARYGLDKPLAQVTMNDVDILFGHNEPLNNRRYALVNNRVHLIADNYFYQAQLQLSALVDNALLPPGQQLQLLQLPGLMLRREPSLGWQLDPADKQVSMDAVNDLIAQWEQASALTLSPYAGDQSHGQIHLEFASGQQLDYEILSREDEVILGRRDIGMRFHLSDEQGERLLSLALPPAE